MTTFVNNQTVITADWLNKVENTIQSEGNIVFSKASGSGVKVDTTTPTYPWVDLIGDIQVKEVGGAAPTMGTLLTGVRALAFSATDKADLSFHIPHDYVLGTDMYIHTHWTHNGTAISGSLVMKYYVTYAKGHNQAIFHSPITLTDTISTPNIATIPRYSHRINEIQLSTSGGGGGGTLLDNDIIEVDGLILVTIEPTTIPTITGGSPNEPYILFVDIHYQSTGIGTKNRSPNFYS